MAIAPMATLKTMLDEPLTLLAAPLNGVTLEVLVGAGTIPELAAVPAPAP